MEYLTISKLNVNKLSEANSSSWWKWLKKLFIGGTIVKFTVFKYRKTGSILFLRPSQFVFSFSPKIETLSCFVVAWNYQSEVSRKVFCAGCEFETGTKRKAESKSARLEGSHWSNLSFLFILVIARVIERVDTLTWTILPGKRFLLETLKHAFSKSFCCILFFRAGMMSVFMVLLKSPLHI